MRIEGLSFGKKKKISQEVVKNQHQETEEPITFRLTKDDNEIAKITKKVLDLNLHDSEDRTGAKQEYKFKLPQGAEKI
jgi:hypothetical protein